MLLSVMLLEALTWVACSVTAVKEKDITRHWGIEEQNVIAARSVAAETGAFQTKKILDAATSEVSLRSATRQLFL